MVRATAEQARQWQRNLRSVSGKKPGTQRPVRKSNLRRMIPKADKGHVKSVMDSEPTRGTRSYAGGESRISGHVRRHAMRARKYLNTPISTRSRRTPIGGARRTVSRPVKIGFTTFGTFLVAITGIAIALSIINSPRLQGVPKLLLTPVNILVAIFRAFVKFAGG